MQTILGMFDDVAERFPDHIAVRSATEIPGEPSEITYRELARESARLAAGLADLGVEKGDRVAIISKPRIRFAQSVFGVLRLGAWVVPIDPSFTTQEIEGIVHHAEPKVVLAAGESFARLSGDPIGIDLDDRRDRTFRSVLADKQVPEISVTPEDVAFLAYTSGTTGDAKGVMLSHGNVMSDLVHGTKVIPIYPDDVLLSIAPWHHILGLVACLILPLYGGGTAIYTDEYRRIAELMPKYSVSIFVGVPKLYHALYGKLKDKVCASLSGRVLWRIAPQIIGRGIKKRLTGGRLRFFVSGSAPLDSKVALGFRRMGIGMMEGYGLTETSPVISLCDPLSKKGGSVGRPIPTVEAKILDPWPDGVGDLLIRGPIVMQGYYKNPQATAQAISKEGWFNTGDLAMLDPDGEIGRAPLELYQSKVENRLEGGECKDEEEPIHRGAGCQDFGGGR
jgi:long-chain acyl-CoA synthetase